MDENTITDIEPAPIYVSFELSKRSWLVASLLPESARPSLCTIPAGDSATMLVAEVFCRQFGNRRQLASFLGLAPSPYNSGSVERHQGISKAGNHATRVLLVELAWCWLRYQPASELSQWYRDRYKGRGKRSAKIGIIALARKLLIALWRFVETGLVPQGAELRAT